MQDRRRRTRVRGDMGRHVRRAARIIIEAPLNDLLAFPVKRLREFYHHTLVRIGKLFVGHYRVVKELDRCLREAIAIHSYNSNSRCYLLSERSALKFTTKVSTPEQ